MLIFFKFNLFHSIILLLSVYQLWLVSLWLVLKIAFKIKAIHQLKKFAYCVWLHISDIQVSFTLLLAFLQGQLLQLFKYLYLRAVEYEITHNHTHIFFESTHASLCHFYSFYALLQLHDFMRTCSLHYSHKFVFNLATVNAKEFIVECRAFCIYCLRIIKFFYFYDSNDHVVDEQNCVESKQAKKMLVYWCARLTWFLSGEEIIKMKRALLLPFFERVLKLKMRRLAA